MIKWRLRGTLVAAFVLAASALAPTKVVAQSTYLIDTGPGATSSIGGSSLFAGGSATCSPQPQCSQAFQFLAGQFTLHEAASIEAIEIWIAGFGTGGSMDVKIRADANGLPSPTAPPLFSAGSIYSKRYDNLPNQFNQPGWLAFGQYEAVLAAGTYWVTFEPVAGSGLNYTVPGQAPNPLAKYAFYANGNPGYSALDSATSANGRLGIRIKGTNFPGLAFGTATRMILTGSTFGGFYDHDFIRAGRRDLMQTGMEGSTLTSSYIFVIPGGHVHGFGKITENGLTAGAYSITSGGCLPTVDCTSAAGAGRGVAYRTLTNMGAAPRTYQFNTILDGKLAGAGRHAFAGVYVFKTDVFSETIINSGCTPAEFLLSRDDLAELALNFSPPQVLSLASLFPPEALLASKIHLVNSPLDQSVEMPLALGPITVNPQESVTVMFDLATYAPPGGFADFGGTLRPAPNFITDESGNPAYDLVAVGPSAGEPPPAASLALGPATATSPLGTAHSVTATVKATDGTPVSDAVVTFTITGGPNAGLTEQIPTDTDGEATLTYLGAALGTDSIQAGTSALQSDVVTNTWTVGALDHITISPASAAIPAGGSQAYTAEAFDIFNNSRGDVTGSTTFSILPEGSCAGAVCTAAAAGAHTVTASHNGVTAAATLNVTAVSTYVFEGFFRPIEMSPQGRVVWNNVKAGQAVPAKWRLTRDGAPVSDRTSFAGLFSYPAACGTGAVSGSGAVLELAPGKAGLVYSGNGNWHFNWKTPNKYKGTCRVLFVKFKDGTESGGAYFKFK